MINNEHIYKSVTFMQDYCSSNPCQHGSCTATSNGYECSCTSGYYGSDCQYKGYN